MSLASAIRTASSGVPHLYAAARASGASHRASSGMVAASAAALVIAAQRHPVEWRKQNAVRHFSWQAFLTARYGLEAARALSIAHEERSSDAVDSTVDRANNVAGQEYAAAHADDLQRGSVRATLTRLAEIAEGEWEAGRLSGARPHDE